MMTKKRGPTPEQFAQWAQERREFEEKIVERERRLVAAEERTRKRLRLLTLGLLGRDGA
jgi:hypothetical protein